MERARAHRRLAGSGSFALLALVAEIAGRSLTVSLDLGRHVPTPRYAGADYYPFLLAGVKVGVALMLAALTWRFVKARAGGARGDDGCSARSARRRAQQRRACASQLSLRSWALAYGLTAGILPRADRQRALRGRTAGRSCRRGCTRRRSPSSRSSPCSSRSSTAPSRAGSPTTSATPSRSPPRRARCCALRPPARTRRARGAIRSSAAPLRARLRVAASSRLGVSPGAPPGLVRRLRRRNEYAVPQHNLSPRARTPPLRAGACGSCRSLGPLTALAGVGWAIVQP